MVNDTLYSLVTEGVSYVEKEMARFLVELSELCLLDSPSDYKPGLDAVAKSIALLLERRGVLASIVEDSEGGNAVLGTLRGERPAAPSVLLLCHHDTVHPVGLAESRVRADETRFFGPGSVDMKAGILLALFALEILVQRGYRDFGKILFFSVPDEETTIRYHMDLLQQLCEEKPLVLVLEGARSVGNVVTSRKGGARYRLIAEGLAAHAGSAPENGKNAVLELAHQIVQFSSLHRWREGVTINAGPMHGGTVPNVVSDFAEVIFDIRYPHLEDCHLTETRWREMMQRQLVPGVKLTLELEPNAMPPMVETEKSRAMADCMQRIVEDMLHAQFDPEIRGGCSDGCNTAFAGCPTIDGLGAIGGKAHHADEYIELASIPQRAGLLAGLIAAITKSI